MPPSFDPYYKWLGIPPEEQPPNHYRLLGIRLFEEDPDVIENAADGRMALVRSFHTGANARQSQQLLNELAAARITLLHPTKRAAYDDELRRSQPPLPLPGSMATSAVAATARVPVDAPWAPITVDPALPRIHAAKHPAAHRSRQLAVLAVAAGVVLLGSAILFMTLRNGRDVAAVPQDPGSVHPAPVDPIIPSASLPLDRETQRDSNSTSSIAPTNAGKVRDDKKLPDGSTDAVNPPPDSDVERLSIPTEKKILLIFRFDDELKAAKEACEQYGMDFETARTFDQERSDYGDCHTILCGTNTMDYWQKGDAAKPEAFDHLEQFVAGGGHLIILGSFNARGTQHLKRFGIETGFYHNENFEPAGLATELLVEGNTDVVPADGRTRSFGNFKVKAPHVVLLKNGKGYRAGEPKLATLEHARGRLTYTVVEPNQTTGMWLIKVLVSWVSRGSPIPRME